MNMRDDEFHTADLEVTSSWARSVTDDLERSRRTAWIVACVAAAVALLLAIALVILMPLKTVEPYTLLVDRQTGHVEALAPLDVQTVSADAALTRSFLVQYVIARESFDADSLARDYNRVALWSADEARTRYLRMMEPNAPDNPVRILPRRAVVSVQIRSVSSLGADRSLVRFTTVRTDPAGRDQAPQYWAAVVTWQYSGAEMSAEDRLINPLGFQVTRYRKDAETLAEAPVVAVPANLRPAPPAMPVRELAQ